MARINQPLNVTGLVFTALKEHGTLGGFSCQPGDQILVPPGYETALARAGVIEVEGVEPPAPPEDRTPVDINAASAEDLQRLDGITDAAAVAIVEARPFASLEDLTRAKGVGDKTVERIAAQGIAVVGEVEPEDDPEPEVDETADDGDEPAEDEQPEDDAGASSDRMVREPGGAR